MKTFFARLFKWIAYTVAGVVILLAIGVGLLRLFLPRLPEYQDQIKAWAGDAIGVDVEFSGMDARWGLSGPELEFLNAELIRRDNDARIIAAEEVSISIALIRLVVDRTVAIDRVVVRESAIEVRQLESGGFWVQGDEVSALLPQREGQAMPAGGEIELIGEDIELRFIQPGDERPKLFDVARFNLTSDEQRVALGAFVRLPDSLGDDVSVSATYLKMLPEEERFWDLQAQFSELQLPGVAALARRPGLTVDSGQGDFDVSMALATDGVRSVAVDMDVEDVSKDGSLPVSLQSRLEYSRNDDGWLLAGSRLRLGTSSGAWPETSFRLDTGLDADGKVASLDAQADYLNLADLALFTPLFDETNRARMLAFAPTGELRALDATITGIGSEQLRYSLSVDMERVSVASVDTLPGISGFSGRIRADESGGRLELLSSDVQLMLYEYLNVPVDLDELRGTVIWRTSGDLTTVLSDNIAIRNRDITAETNVQLTIDGDNAPVIDLASRWTVVDLGSAKRYIPEKKLHPNLYNWFQNALLSGRIDNGRTRLYGPLDKYPFDNGEGRFLLEATVEDSLFKYLRQWPTSEIRRMDVILENTRLFTEKNLSYAEGLETRDARVEIADLREPVLRIEGVTTGDMASLVQFSRNSPIDRLLGGRLESVSVSGTASADLDLTVPLKQWREFEFTAGVNASEASLIVDGLKPPITDINGRVVIEKATIAAEDLTASFLGDTIGVNLKRAAADMQGYQVIATVDGRTSAEAVAEGFGLPIEGLATGASDYTATLLFPSGGEQPNPLAIGIASKMDGVAIALPEPFGKSADEVEPIQGDIRIRSTGISTTGRTADLSWYMNFLSEGGLDFDRGTLLMGSDAAASEPETRGLHIRGDVSRFDLDEWLALSSGTEADTDVVGRIRSAEVTVADLSLLGQRYENHWLRMDRSARDWQLQVRGDSVEGNITLPYQFSADTTLTLEMQRLLLPGDDSDADAGEEGVDATEASQVDPRRLPSISLRADEFALGERYLGRVEADIVRTDAGLVAERFIATDPSFEIVGTGSWLADSSDPTGYKVSAIGGLQSTDIKSTMQRLNYQPGINGEDLSVVSDVSWSGGPSNAFLATLNGEVQVRFGPGQLDDIDPGAGRVFGLMSVVALPRRLSLDFSDVFQRGFGFDQIEGTFRIVDGDTYTCNLSLEGPAAAIGIVGRAGLVAEDYEQSAIVSANFGNALPIGAAVIAGPQAAVAALIFSQIFKKPLEELSQVYYDIDGSWAEPNMVSSGAESFADKGRLAGCVNGESQP
ncbi:MAG: YhdP family protein [Pseudomonadota bacterium]